MRFSLVVFAAILVSTSALAQRRSGPPLDKKVLSKAAEARLHTLDELNELPATTWRVHPGDLPHGEAVALDDSAWRPVPGSNVRGEAGKLGQGAAWLRNTIVIPRTVKGYDITGSRIWFQVHANAHGELPEILYVNGNRVALGEDLEPIVLTEAARPGDKFLIAAKLLETSGSKELNGVSLHIEFQGKRPNPEDIREQCVASAALLPHLPRPQPESISTVEKAIAAIDMHALEAGNQDAFDQSLLHAQEMLSTLHTATATAHMNLVGNSHIDAAWLWPKTETVDIVHRTFATAIQLMNEYPDYKYTQSASQYSQWVADKYPDLNRQIAQRIKEGRWEIVGGMWVEPDLNLPGGESIVRQLLVGQRVFHDLYGVVAKIGWNPDTFGYNWQMPQIYKRSGIDYFVTQKMGWNDTNQLPLRLFWWESPDGSKVLTYFPTSYAHRDASPGRLSNDFARSAERNPGTVEYADLYGVGDHGGGPTRMMLDQATHWIDASKTTQDAVPTMRFSTMQQFFDTVQTHLNSDSPVWDYAKLANGWTPPPTGVDGSLGIPTWNDELYLEKHRGVFTTQTMHKWNMRHSEDETIDAEKFASLAWLDGDAYPASTLTDNWKAITFNQFHDLAAGSGIGTIYKDAQKEYDQVFTADRAMNEASRKTIEARIETGLPSGGTQGSVPVVVWNTMSWARSGIVEFTVEGATPGSAGLVHVTDASGKPVQATSVVEPSASPVTSNASVARIRAMVNDVPAMGYKLLHVSWSPGGTEPTHPEAVQDTGSSIVLTNEHIGVTIRKSDGCVTSMVKDGTQYLAPNACANELQAIADNPKNYDAWDIDPGEYDVPPTKLDKVDSVAVVEKSALRNTVRITRSWSKSKFTEDISLAAGSSYVEFNNTIDWHEEHILLKAAFPLAASAPKATYEIPFGAIERETTRDNSFTRARFEVPAQRWGDLGDGKQGVSLLNDAKYGYDTLGNVMRLTLLRSPKYPDPEADMGIQHMRYALYPHTGTWQIAQTVHRGYEFDVPLTAEQVFSHSGTLPAEHSFASVDAPNVILAAVKKAEDSNALVFRVYEASGSSSDVQLHVPAGAESARETNLMETPEGDSHAVKDDTVSFSIQPYQILTIEVSYPAK